MIDFQLQIYFADVDCAEQAEERAEAKGFGDITEVHYGLHCLDYVEKLLVEDKDIERVRGACPKDDPDDDFAFVLVFDTEGEKPPPLMIDGLHYLGTFPGVWRDDDPVEIPDDPNEVEDWGDDALRGRVISIGLSEPCDDKSLLRELKTITGRSIGDLFKALKAAEPLVLVDLVAEYPGLIERAHFKKQVVALIQRLEKGSLPIQFGVSFPQSKSPVPVSRELALEALGLT